MKIYCPSYKRGASGEAITHKILPDLTYLVTKEEEGDYLGIHDKVMVLPDEVRYKERRINYVLDMHDEGDWVVFIDDDVKRFRRWVGTDLIDMEDPVEFLEMGFVMCEDIGFKLWGVNCAWDKGSYREYTPLSTKSFIAGPLNCNIVCDLRMDERFVLKHDYDFVLQHLNVYRGVLRFNYINLDFDLHTKGGGSSTNRTVKAEMEEMGLLRNKWGSKIVNIDWVEKVHAKKKKKYDVDPIIKVPIKGV